MNKQKRIKILNILEKTKFNSRVKIQFTSPFELLISLILSAQTTDIQVNLVTKKLYTIANTPYKVLKLGEKKLRKYIQKIGLYNRKASYIIKTCKILVEDYESKIPNNRKNLEELPGVGRKVANIILNVIFNQPTIAVDTHIFRFCNRTGFAPGKNVLQVEKALSKKVPKTFRLNCHRLLIEQGRNVCVAFKPFCAKCTIFNLCEFKNKTNTNRI